MAALAPRPLADLDAPLERARLDAARLIARLADLDAARHYGLRVAARHHLTDSQAILGRIAVDLDAVARVLAGVDPAPSTARTVAYLPVGSTCPDCGHGAYAHASAADLARWAVDDERPIYCVSLGDTPGSCGCTRTRPDREPASRARPCRADLLARAGRASWTAAGIPAIRTRARVLRWSVPESELRAPARPASR